MLLVRLHCTWSRWSSAWLHHTHRWRQSVCPCCFSRCYLQTAGCLMYRHLTPDRITEDHISYIHMSIMKIDCVRAWAHSSQFNLYLSWGCVATCCFRCMPTKRRRAVDLFVHKDKTASRVFSWLIFINNIKQLLWILYGCLCLSVGGIIPPLTSKRGREQSLTRAILLQAVHIQVI